MPRMSGKRALMEMLRAHPTPRQLDRQPRLSLRARCVKLRARNGKLTQTAFAARAMREADAYAYAAPNIAERGGQCGKLCSYEKIGLRNEGFARFRQFVGYCVSFGSVHACDGVVS